MNRKKLSGFRSNNLDKEMFGLLAAKKEIVKCCNGHFNQKSALICWKCGAWLRLTGSPKKKL